ncbi:MAG TPA: DUF3093 family protein [Actinomycetota bacterium]|nr:DUF3093 family protein [Actinomycetota bacterium]
MRTSEPLVDRGQARRRSWVGTLSQQAAPELLYREEQRPPWWVWLLVLPFCAFVTHRTVISGIAPNAFLVLSWVLGAVLPIALLIASKMITTVTTHHLEVQWVPLWTRDVDLDTIESLEEKKYRPLRDWVGWGIHYSPKLGWVYNVRGTQGVWLRLSDRKPLLVGSRDPSALAGALVDALERRA